MQTREVHSTLDQLTDEYEYDIFVKMHNKHFIYEDEAMHWNTLRQYADCLRQLNAAIKEKNIHLNCGIFEDYLLSMFKLNKDTLTSEAAQKVIPFDKKEEKYWHTSCEGLFEYLDITRTVSDLGWVAFQYGDYLQDIAKHFAPWLAELSPDRINEYQLKSIDHFVNTSHHKSITFAREIIIELNQQCSNITENEFKLLQLVSQLYSAMSTSRMNQHDFYLMTVVSELNTLLKEIPTDKKVDWLRSNVENYIHHKHEYEYVKSLNNKFLDDVKDLLNPHKISVHDSDVIEHTLLLAAGVDIPESLRSMLPLPEGERFKLRFNGLPLERAEKLKVFLLQHDNTVTLTEGKYRAHWASSPRGWPSDETFDTLDLSLNPKTVYEVILPLFKQAFLERVAKGDLRLAEYQKLSEKEFTITKESGIQSEDEQTERFAYSPTLFTKNHSNMKKAANNEPIGEAKNTASI